MFRSALYALLVLFLFSSIGLALDFKPFIQNNDLMEQALRARDDRQTLVAAFQYLSNAEKFKERIKALDDLRRAQIRYKRTVTCLAEDTMRVIEKDFNLTTSNADQVYKLAMREIAFGNGQWETGKILKHNYQKETKDMVRFLLKNIIIRNNNDALKRIEAGIETLSVFFK